MVSAARGMLYVAYVSHLLSNIGRRVTTPSSSSRRRRREDEDEALSFGWFGSPNYSGQLGPTASATATRGAWSASRTEGRTLGHPYSYSISQPCSGWRWVLEPLMER